MNTETTYKEQWQAAANVLRAHADKLDKLAETAPSRPAPEADALKIAVCQYLLRVNDEHEGPFIPPTAIDWLGNGIVSAVLEATTDSNGDADG